MRTFLDLCRRFQRDERGAFIAIFGVLAIVLIATAGAVVDYTAVEQARTRAQVALDAASLALQSSIYTQNEAWLKTKAQAVLTERIADTRITATVQTVTKDVSQGEIFMTATVRVPMSFVALIGITQMTATIKSKATRGSKNIEVGLALDITYSMNGSKIADLIDAITNPTTGLIEAVVQDNQTPTYSRMALVPYSNAVNLGSTYAATARGAVQDYTNITAAAWLTPSSSAAFTISAVTKANPGRITTTANHGFTTGQTVTIYAAAGGGFTALNGNTYTITVTSATQFTIGISTSAYTGTYTANSGRVTMGTTRVASAVSKQNPGRITTTLNHGLVTGDAVYITSAAGGGFTALNNKAYKVTWISNTVFSLQTIAGVNVSTSAYTGTYTANSAIIRKCITTECEVEITSASHNMSDGEVAWIQSMVGMTQFNNNHWLVSQATANTFVLEDSDGTTAGTYTSGGRTYCVTSSRNCAYNWYQISNGTMVAADPGAPISNCVSERVGANAYTEVSPGTAKVGNVYPSVSGSFGDCPGEQFVPLTDDKDLLTDEVNAYTVEGSTAGQIGLAWAWYAISPEFASMFPTNRGGATYDTPDLIKIVILMTDGAFNTAYCNGVISEDTGINESPDNRANCNANNGDPFDQADSLCTAIKKGGDGVANTSDDIVLYTVAFDLGSDQDAIDLMAGCATDADHAYAADDGDELADAFQDIGDNIAALRIAQ